MQPALRLLVLSAILSLGSLLTIGTSPTQAQSYTDPGRTYTDPGRTYYYPAPTYYYPAPTYYYPAPTYYYPAPTYAQPDRNGSYSYYDRDGIEHDSRYLPRSPIATVPTATTTETASNTILGLFPGP